jgi:hypothetical protein
MRSFSSVIWSAFNKIHAFGLDIPPRSGCPGSRVLVASRVPAFFSRNRLQLGKASRLCIIAHQRYDCRTARLSQAIAPFHSASPCGPRDYWHGFLDRGYHLFPHLCGPHRNCLANAFVPHHRQEIIPRGPDQCHSNCFLPCFPAFRRLLDHILPPLAPVLPCLFIHCRPRLLLRPAPPSSIAVCRDMLPALCLSLPFLLHLNASRPFPPARIPAFLIVA